MPLEELEAVLERVSELSNDVPVLVKADEETPLRVLTEVMDACRLNGLSKIRLQSR